ncbi:MAG: PIN domain-containing protein, partial [Dehalococcoidia bacterium]
ITVDAGVLLAAERNEQKFWMYWRTLAHLSKVVPTPVLAQVWRGDESIPLLRALEGCRIEPLDEADAKAAGELCARTRTRDVVDATVMVSAARRGDDILTTDVRDLRRLTAGLRFTGRIVDFDRLANP